MTLAEAETATRSSRNCQICGTFSWPQLKPLCLQGAATACSMWSDGSGQMAQLVSYLTGVKLLLCDASGHKAEKCSFLNVQLQSLTLTSIRARLQGRLLSELR